MSEPRAERLLAIDTSSRRGSLSIDWEGRVEHAQLLDSRAHASDLLPALAELLSKVDAQREDGLMAFTRIIVGTGPGSYTGLRIGLATARSLAWASSAELVGIPSFEALAYSALEPGEVAAIAQDARASRFYYARYEREGESLREHAAPQLCTKQELAGALGDERIILGNEDVLCSIGLEETHAGYLRSQVWPSSEALLSLGRISPSSSASQSVEPLYLRAFGE